MTPEQALSILDDMTSRIPMARNDHATAITAVNTIKEALEALTVLKTPRAE